MLNLVSPLQPIVVQYKLIDPVDWHATWDDSNKQIVGSASSRDNALIRPDIADIGENACM